MCHHSAPSTTIGLFGVKVRKEDALHEYTLDAFRKSDVKEVCISSPYTSRSAMRKDEHLIPVRSHSFPRQNVIC